MPPVGGGGDNRQSRRERWRGFGAGLLSSLIPGTGQLYAGERRRGALMLVLTAACATVGLLLIQTLRSPEAQGRVVEPRVLLFLFLANLLLLAFRVAAAADAYWLNARRSLHAPLRRWWRFPLALVLLLVITTSPHAVVAYLNVKAFDLVNTILASDGSGRSLTQRILGGPTEAEAPALQSMNVLLIGGDAGPDREGLRTDSMMVARIDTETGRALLFGLPRNLVQVPLPAGPLADTFGPCQCFPRPLNELYAFAELERPDLFEGDPNPPGIAALMGAAETLLDLNIDHYLLVDLKGFVEVVDALGGVDVEVRENVWVEIDHLGERQGGRAFFLRPGSRHLDGFTALAYSRSRDEKNEDGGNDYSRMRRQRCLLGAIADQANPAKLALSLPKLVDVVKDNVRTNVPLTVLPQAIALLREQRPELTAIGFAPPAFNSGWADGYPIPDADKIQRTVHRTLAPPATTRPKAETADATTTTRGDNGTETTRPRSSPTSTHLDPESSTVDTC